MLGLYAILFFIGYLIYDEYKHWKIRNRVCGPKWTPTECVNQQKTLQVWNQYSTREEDYPYSSPQSRFMNSDKDFIQASFRNDLNMMAKLMNDDQRRWTEKRVRELGYQPTLDSPEYKTFMDIGRYKRKD